MFRNGCDNNDDMGGASQNKRSRLATTNKLAHTTVVRVGQQAHFRVVDQEGNPRPGLWVNQTQYSIVSKVL